MGLYDNKPKTSNIHRQRTVFLALTITFASVSLILATALTIVGIVSTNKITDQTDTIASLDKQVSTKSSQLSTFSTYVKKTSGMFYEYLEMCERAYSLKGSNAVAATMWTWCGQFVNADAQSISDAFKKIQEIPEFKSYSTSDL